jgi:hypothetical protein
VTGAFISTPASGFATVPAAPMFYAWQPSTWPNVPTTVDDAFIENLKRIFEDSILGEISNVISDAKKSNGDLQHRGHVVAISLMCAVDAISSYGYGAQSGKQIPDFMRAHFPAKYHLHADSILFLYRHAMVHSWNLFAVSISPGDEPIAECGGVISFGLLNFFDALTVATENFLEKLLVDVTLQKNTLERYNALKKSAKS